jgi:rare lipoprotein A
MSRKKFTLRGRRHWASHTRDNDSPKKTNASRIVLGELRFMIVTKRPIHAGFALLALLLLGAAGCGRHVARVNVPVAPARIGVTETGMASWYGIPYHGRRAASGEIYDMEKLTAAHRRLPFQTWVEVTNLSNGKRVDVRINDRGPFAHGRVIDLSQAAARDIDMLGPGTARVRLRVIAKPPEETPAEPSGPVDIPRVAVTIPSSAGATTAGAAQAVDWFVVQAGAFADRDRAESLRASLEEIFADARVVAGSRNLWRVLVGRQMTHEQATDLAVRVRQQLGGALIVPEPEPNTPADSSSNLP